MQLSKTKIISLFLIGFGLAGFSAFASADDLKISNDSAYDLSFSINNTCSSEFGVVEARTIQIVSTANFKQVCASSPAACEAKVYNAAACGGAQVATIVFDTSYGVQALKPTGITAKGNGFNLFFKGPWPHQ